MISIEAATRTCKVDTASAARIESDRFLNPNLVMCPNWTGKDLTGRTVCPDSFYTKRAGCNSAADRVIVENNLRPAYFEYINLSAAGIRDQMYGENFHYTDAGVSNVQEKFAETQTGHFGGIPSWPGTNEAVCSYGRYTEGQKQSAAQMQDNRERQGAMTPGNTRKIPVNEGYRAAPNSRRPPRRGGSPPKMTGFRPGPEGARKNAALTNGFRSNQFRGRSGF